jgi:hypothetical protein
MDEAPARSRRTDSFYWQQPGAVQCGPLHPGGWLLGSFGLHFGFLHFEAVEIVDVTRPEPPRIAPAATGDIANPENPNPAISIAPATFNSALFIKSSLISPAR